jgi:hypothetical protein
VLVQVIPVNQILTLEAPLGVAPALPANDRKSLNIISRFKIEAFHPKFTITESLSFIRVVHVVIKRSFVC